MQINFIMKSSLMLGAVLLLASCTLLEKNRREDTLYRKIKLVGKREQLWRALTNSEELSKWWNQGVRIKPVKGGDFYEPWGDGQVAFGKVIALKSKKMIRFTWTEKNWDKPVKTVCEFRIQQTKEGIALIVKHSGWEQFGAQKDQMLSGFGKGWDSLLPRLEKHLKTAQ